MDGCQLGWAGATPGALVLVQCFEVQRGWWVVRWRWRPLPLPLSALDDALEIAGALLHAPRVAQPTYIHLDNGM